MLPGVPVTPLVRNTMNSIEYVPCSPMVKLPVVGENVTSSVVALYLPTALMNISYAAEVVTLGVVRVKLR
jgi:hypothetical protein